MNTRYGVNDPSHSGQPLNTSLFLRIFIAHPERRRSHILKLLRGQTCITLESFIVGLPKKNIYLSGISILINPINPLILATFVCSIVTYVYCTSS
jgi:hypothetical protein